MLLLILENVSDKCSDHRHECEDKPEQRLQLLNVHFVLFLTTFHLQGEHLMLHFFFVSCAQDQVVILELLNAVRKDQITLMHVQRNIHSTKLLVPAVKQFVKVPFGLISRELQKLHLDGFCTSKRSFCVRDHLNFRQFQLVFEHFKCRTQLFVHGQPLLYQFLGLCNSAQVRAQRS